MKFTDLQKYKHDTIGKFQILAELLEDITEENMKSAESLEILKAADEVFSNCLLYTSPSPRDGLLSRMPSSA